MRAGAQRVVRQRGHVPMPREADRGARRKHARVGLRDDVVGLRVHRVVCYALAGFTSAAWVARPAATDSHAEHRPHLRRHHRAAHPRARSRHRRDYAEAGQLHIVCVLKGAFMFLADLVRAIDMPVTLDFMALSSYAKGTTSSGEVRLLKDLDSRSRAATCSSSRTSSTRG